MTESEMHSLRAAYVMLLMLPHDSVRLRLQPLLATLRDEIAAGSGQSSEEVQEYFEAIVSMSIIDKFNMLNAANQEPH